MPFSPVVAASSLAVVIGAALAWYALRGTWFGSQAMVVPIACAGCAVFLLALWAARGVPPWRLGRETRLVMVAALGFLALLWYFGRRDSYPSWFGAHAGGALEPLYSFFFTTGASVVARALLPLAVVVWVLRRRPADIGYGLPTDWSRAWLYLAGIAVAVVAVVWVSTLPSFLRAYPRCGGLIADGTLDTGSFVAYQVAYGVFFYSGESFWRGFILFGLARELGYMAVFFSLIPYAISHFGKPQPEVFGAMATAVFFGFLALRHGSFWLGVAAHWFIGFFMDVIASWRRGVDFA